MEEKRNDRMEVPENVELFGRKFHLQWFAEEDGGEGNEPAGTEPDQQVDQGDSGDPAGDGGSGTYEGWLSAVTPDLRKHELLRGMKGPSDLAKAYVDLNGRLESSIAVPKEDAPEEEKQAYREKIRSLNGVPESPEEYQLDTPDLPEGLNYSDDDVSVFKAMSHEMGLNQEQVNKLFQWDTKRRTDAYNKYVEERKAERETADKTLKESWGDDYERNMNMVAAVVKKYADEKLNEYMDESGVGNHPVMFRFLLDVAKDMIGDHVPRAGGGGTSESGGLSYPWMRDAYPVQEE